MIVNQIENTVDQPSDQRPKCDDEVLTELICPMDEGMTDEVPEPSQPRDELADKLDGLFESVESQRQKIDQLLVRDEVLQHVSRRLTVYEQNEWQRTFVATRSTTA